MIGAQVGVIQVIESLRGGVIEPAQRERAGTVGKSEAGMEFVGGRKIGLSIGKDDFELVRIDNRASRKHPGSEVGIGSSDVKAVQGNGVAAGIVKFQPRGALAGMVGKSEAGMEFVGGRKIGLSIGKDDFELVRIDNRASRKHPGSEVVNPHQFKVIFAD